jgi:glutaminyl-peptide cyclotransferase
MRAKRLLGKLVFVSVLLGLSVILLWHSPQPIPSLHMTFDGKRAYGHVMTQMAFGPRITGTEGNRKAGDYIAEQLRQDKWSVEFENFTYRDTPVRNVIGRANRGRGPIIILGAHYDTRIWADNDENHPRDPVPGANDGASGVAVLLELARTLDLRRVHYEVWLGFFDAEDNGGINGWDWIVGSTYMARNLLVRPQAMILVDMIGGIDQRIYFDGNSDLTLSQKVWSIAANLGYGNHFLAQVRWNVIDDHIPFLQQGIPAIDIIDLDYAYWHTTADTADKVSPDSLERVGRTIQVFLETTEQLT